MCKMEKGFECVFVLVLSCMVCVCHSATLLDHVEPIPKDMHVPGSDSLGKSLSLNNANMARLRRNYGDQQWIPVERRQHGLPRGVYSDRVADQAAAGSEVQDHGYKGVNGHSYGNEQEANDYYGRENSGVSAGEVGFYGRTGKKGSQEHVASDGYREKERGSHDNRQDKGFYDQASGAKKLHDVGKAYQGAQTYANDEQGVERQASKVGRRKGHRKSGFTNSYHKDESGNKSDFFDDAIDEGDRFESNTRDGYFTDRAGSRQHGNFQDSAFKNNAQGKKGSFDEGRNFNDQDVQKGNYARERFADDKVDYGQRRSGETYDRASQGAQEQNDVNYYGKNGQAYVKRRGYIVPYQPPAVPQRSYYPVRPAVGVDEEYYPASPPVYSPSRSLQAAPREYYPSQQDVYPAKPANYDLPPVYAPRASSGQGYAIYSDAASAASPHQYYMPRSAVYYIPSASY